MCEMAIVANEPCSSGQSSLTPGRKALASLASFIHLGKRLRGSFHVRHRAKLFCFVLVPGSCLHFPGPQGTRYAI